MEWPSQSLDLNPIENLWTKLKRRVSERLPTNFSDLYQYCLEEWETIPREYCEKLIKDYPKRSKQKEMQLNINLLYVNL